ncbi:helix-turn-helix domain-containing protein [Archangium primigenium]|uniref:helix-turn-helix domain-containing protein n=1 Tax=[Archangium] primigenium TaxID=2792470 RepID=UPI001959B1A7|nr:helix-turn-helix domain-containing protein [Archangium primigenium]MBM7114921.1 helix-turn-helix domain-containing protein [Archangium primigenium]
MSQDLYTVEQVASLLDLHVRTVRVYVREGRLKATRIGKQYRITREAIEALTGRSMSPPERRRSHVEVSSIVEIEDIERDAAMRIANGLVAASNSSDEGESPLRVDTLYDPKRERLKLIVTGPLGANTRLLQLVALYLESES